MSLHLKEDHRKIAAIILKHPKIASRLDKSLPYPDELRLLVDIAIEHVTGKKTYKLTGKVVSNMTNEIDKTTLSAIDKWLPDIPNSESEATGMISVINERLLKNYQLNRLVTRTELAREELLKGNISEGVKLMQTTKITLHDKQKSTLDLMFESHQDVFFTNIKEMDEMFNGFVRGELMAVMADSGAMKTYMTFYLMVDILKNNPTLKGVYFQKEMAAASQYTRLASIILGIADKEINRRNKTAEGRAVLKEEVLHALDNNKPLASAIERLRVVGPDEFNNVSDMVVEVNRHGADIWCLDFLTMLVGSGRINDEMFNIGKDLKDLALATNSWGMVISQLKKVDIEVKDMKVPYPDDMEYGNKLKQVAADIIALFYPNKYNEMKWDNLTKMVYYIVARKQRYNEPGQFLCTEAKPSEHKFRFMTGNEKARAEKWLRQYMSKS